MNGWPQRYPLTRSTSSTGLVHSNIPAAFSFICNSYQVHVDLYYIIRVPKPMNQTAHEILDGNHTDQTAQTT